MPADSRVSGWLCRPLKRLARTKTERLHSAGIHREKWRYECLSGVTVGGVQHGPISKFIKTGHQATCALVDRQAQLQPVLDQA
ncbi:MAG: hypothetical protein QM650_16500 [Microlunatus sp.]